MKFKPDHWSNENDLPQGGTGPAWRAFRAFWYKSDNHGASALRIEWYTGRHASSTGLEYTRDYSEDEHGWYVGLRRLFGLYITLPAKSQGSRYDCRYYGISIHDWAVWFKFGGTDDWSNKDPWWWSFNFQIADFILGDSKMVETELSKTREALPLPEGPVAVDVTLKYCVWRRPRWPWAIHRVYRAEVEPVDPDGIGVPGKGENAWDCGDSSIQSLCLVARTVEEALGSVVATVLRTRMRHGGSHEHTPAETGQ